ncbi:MAG: hypothetical protein IJR44_03660, partial [Neisseriaceae bacterium]|nr:hypothetical protein [Neisseriaceae bacterium]
IFQSTAENPRKIENTADEHSKEVLSKHHTYIEALKADFQYWVDMGDYTKADERLGDIRSNQQMFDERIRKELDIKFDMMGQPEPTEQPQGNLTISHGADNRQSETLKSYDWYQEQIKQADEKVKDAQFELAKQPENAARQEALEKAITQKTALELECRYGVSSPKLVDLQKEVIKLEAYNQQQSELWQKNQPHDLNSGLRLFEAQEAFKAELAEIRKTLPPDFQSPAEKAILDGANKVFHSDDLELRLVFIKTYTPETLKEAGVDEKQIKDTITKALQDKDFALRKLAINSPQMKPEWLQKVIEKHPDQKTVQYAQKVLNKEPLEKSSGFSSPASNQAMIAKTVQKQHKSKRR